MVPPLKIENLRTVFFLSFFFQTSQKAGGGGGGGKGLLPVPFKPAKMGGCSVPRSHFVCRRGLFQKIVPLPPRLSDRSQARSSGSERRCSVTPSAQSISERSAQELRSKSPRLESTSGVLPCLTPQPGPFLACYCVVSVLLPDDLVEFVHLLF